MTDNASKKSLIREFREILTTETAVLFVASFITPAAAFMLYPFLTIYFTHALGFSVALAGLLLALRFLSGAVLGFLGGMVSDRFGLVRTYVWAGLVTALAIFLLGFQHSVLALVILLLIVGVSASTVNANVRGLANLGVKPEHRGTVQNYVHWLNNLGMAVALPFSADVLHGGYSVAPFVVTAVGYLAMAALVGVTYTRIPSESGGAETLPASKRLSPWQIVRQDRAFAWLLGSFLLWVTVEMQFESNIPLDLSYHFAHGAELYGTLGVIDMVIVCVLQLVISRWLADQKSPWLGYMGFLLLGGLIVGGLWQTVAGWTVAIVLLSVGEVFSISQIMGLMGVLPRDGQQGSYFALFGMAQGLATFFAYFLGGAAYQALGPAALFGLCLPAAVVSAYLYRNARWRHESRTAEAAAAV